MRTTLDLPDDLLQRAKIEATRRGLTLRQLVTNALQRELAGADSSRKRPSRPRVKLAADAPLRRLGPEAIKRMDVEHVQHSDLSKARALHR